MMARLVPFVLVLVVTAVRAFAGELPAFDSDAAADRWLRDHSGFYKTMAAAVDARGGYSFQGSGELALGMVRWKEGKPVIELGDSLKGAKRVSILIFSLADIYESRQHQEVDADAAQGRIASEREFDVLHALVQLDGLRHHRKVLEELDSHVGGVPAEMLQWINPQLRTLSGYLLPMAYDFVKAQETGANARHYHEWFYKQKGK